MLRPVLFRVAVQLPARHLRERLTFYSQTITAAHVYSAKIRSGEHLVALLRTGLATTLRGLLLAATRIERLHTESALVAAG